MEQGEQGLSFEVLHDHVRGAVTFEELKHPHDARMIEAQERLRLLEKLVQPPAVPLLRLARFRVDIAVGLAHRELRRHVLLDGDVDTKIRVPTAIGNAEPAAPEDFEQLEFPQPRARRQRIPVCDFLTHRATAPRRRNCRPVRQVTLPDESRRRVRMTRGHSRRRTPPAGPG